MNMFKKVSASSVKEYVDSIPEERKEMVATLHKLIQQTVPEYKPYFANNMIGYGSFKYTNYKKQEDEWPIIALANQKNYVSVYVCAIDKTGKEYLAEKYKKELGKVSVGKSCIRIKKLDQVDLQTLKKVLKMAVKNPGLVSSH